MNHREAFYLRIGLLVVGAVSLIGVVLLFITRDIKDPSTSFELVVFMMSSVALVLAIVQGVAIERQMREIKKSSIRISVAVKELDELINTEKAQNKLIKDDLELDKLFYEFIDKYGLELNKQELIELTKLLKQLKHK